MIDGAQKSDPAANYYFSRNWGDGRLYLKLAEEAARWLADRRKVRAQASTTLSRHARMRSWRAST